MIFKMTGQPVSQEMQDVIDRLEHGNHVPSSEINIIPEVKLAYSILESQGKYTNIDLETRKPLQDSIYKEMEQITSAAVDENGEIVVDEDGETVYNGIVNKEARLDIIMGLPASGKSSSLVDPISSEFKSRLIDNDEAKKKFPEYNNGWGAAVVHKESQEICDKLFYDCLVEKENIVLPKVGRDSTKLLESYIQKAKAEGYKVYVHFADLDRNKAMGRMLRRFCEKGRFLKPELADKYAPVINGKTHNYIQDAYKVLKTSGMVDGFTKWDNDVAYGEKPILLENIGCEGKFIDNARTEKEVQGYGEYEPRGHEQSGHEILGDYGSGGGVRGKEFHSGSIHNKALESIPQSSERDKASVVRSSLEQLPASGDYGDEHRGSAGIGEKIDSGIMIRYPEKDREEKDYGGANEDREWNSSTADIRDNRGGGRWEKQNVGGDRERRAGRKSTGQNIGSGRKGRTGEEPAAPRGMASDNKEVLSDTVSREVGDAKPSYTLNKLQQDKVEKDIRDAAAPETERTEQAHLKVSKEEI